MKALLRHWLNYVMRWFSRYPLAKRLVVDMVYRFPALDARLRTLAHRAAHPDAVLDVDATNMPDATRRAFERMRVESRP